MSLLPEGKGLILVIYRCDEPLNCWGQNRTPGLPRKNTVFISSTLNHSYQVVVLIPNVKAPALIDGNPGGEGKDCVSSYPIGFSGQSCDLAIGSELADSVFRVSCDVDITCIVEREVG